MIVRDTAKLIGTDRHVETDAWTSVRIFAKDDGLGFSFHETRVRAGTEQTLHYMHHVEAVVIVDGSAELVDAASGDAYTLSPGSAYALDGDRHIFRAITDVVCYCVFLPGLAADEKPDGNGVYAV